MARESRVTVRLIYARANQDRLRAPARKRQWLSLFTSVLLHGAAINVLAHIHLISSEEVPIPRRHLVAHLEMPQDLLPERPAEKAEESSKPAPPEVKPAPKKEVQAPPVAKLELPEPPERKPVREIRRFQLPPRPKAQPVKQTVILEGVPAETVVPVQAQLPTLLSWTPPKLRPPTKQFTAPPPPTSKPSPVQLSLPAAPVLENPNQEIALGKVNLALTPINNLPRLPQIATTSVPVSSPGPEPAKEIPQIAPKASNQPPSVNVISQPNAPPTAASAVVLPQANQIAPEDRGGSGSEGGNATPKVVPPGSSPVLPNSSPAAPSVIETIPGVTRLTQPPDGKFAAVVQGTPDSTRYPEGKVILGARAVYTVYLRVGMRKNWILQYTPAKEAGTGGSGTVEPPWPLVMMRPDQLSTQPTYVMLHARITAAGEFDQISMVSAVEVDRDLLLKSLKLWKFRPASRDGQPVPVEILLIIPRQID